MLPSVTSVSELEKQDTGLEGEGRMYVIEGVDLVLVAPGIRTQNLTMLLT